MDKGEVEGVCRCSGVLSSKDCTPEMNLKLVLSVSIILDSKTNKTVRIFSQAAALNQLIISYCSSQTYITTRVEEDMEGL